MASKTVVLAENGAKKDVVITTAGAASSNVTIIFDDTLSNAQVYTLIEKAREVIIEDEY